MQTVEQPRELSDKPAYAILAHWWWAIVAGALIGAVIGFGSARKAPIVYEADALVVASSSSIQAADFGPLAEAAFTTNTVLQPVIDRLGLTTTPPALLASGQLRAKSVSGTVALRITGRSRDRQLAADMASTAAESFASAATDRQMGTFAVFGPGGVPGSRQPPLTRQNTLLGALGGAAIATVLVLLLIVARRPLHTLEQANREFGADAAFSARVRFPLSDILPWQIYRRAQIYPRGLIPAIWHRLDSRPGIPAVTGLINASGERLNDPAEARKVCCVLVTKGRRTNRALMVVLQVLKAQSRLDAHRADQLVSAHFDGTSMPYTLEGATTVIALVAAGAPRRWLQALDEELRASFEDIPRVLILVRRTFGRVGHPAVAPLTQGAPARQPVSATPLGGSAAETESAMEEPNRTLQTRRYPAID
jgi:hypothetical protein